MPRMTTTRAGFRVEDITFKNARQQSEILVETDQIDDTDEGNVVVPVSMTPEQVKSFFEAKKEATQNGREKRLYDQTIKWIDELLDTKKKLIVVEEKLETLERVSKADEE